MQKIVRYDIRKFGRLKTGELFNKRNFMRSQAFSDFPPRFPQPVEKYTCEKEKNGKSFPVFRGGRTKISVALFPQSFLRNRGREKRKVFWKGFGKSFSEKNHENSLMMLLISYSNALSSFILLLTTSMDESRVVWSRPNIFAMFLRESVVALRMT